MLGPGGWVWRVQPRRLVPRERAGNVSRIRLRGGRDSLQCAGLQAAFERVQPLWEGTSGWVGGLMDALLVGGCLLNDSTV